MFTILLLFWSTLEVDWCIQMHINGTEELLQGLCLGCCYRAITEIVDPVLEIYMTVSTTTDPISMSSGSSRRNKL